MSESKYYNFDRIRSYNKMYNMIVGARGCGKTYGAKRIAIKNFIKKGEQFVYVRRYKSEIKEDRKFEQFFDDIRQEFPEHELTIKGKKAFCDGVVCGYAIPLSTATAVKSVPFPFVTTIIFDEFIIDGGYNYLSNEAERFLDLCSTVGRDRDNVTIYLLANNVTVANPYYAFWGICPKKSDRFVIINEEAILEQVTNDVFIKEQEKNRFTRLIKNTDYYKFNILNESIQDSEEFIREIKPKFYDDKFVLNIDDIKVQVSYTKDGLVYCHDKINPNCIVYNTSFANAIEGEKILTMDLKFKLIYITEKFRNNELFFKSQIIKQKVILNFVKNGIRI